MGIKKADLLKLEKQRKEKDQERKALEKKAKAERAKDKKKIVPKKKQQVVYKVGPQHSRQQRIKECTRCSGNPPAVEFQLNDFEGHRCEICFEIIDYKPR